MAHVFVPVAEEACRPQTPETIKVHIKHRGVRYTFVVPSESMWRVAQELFEAIPEKVGRSWRFYIQCGGSILGGPGGQYVDEEEIVKANGFDTINAEETVTLYEPDDSEATFCLRLQRHGENYTDTRFHVHFDKTTIMQVVEAFASQPLSQGRSWVFRTTQSGPVRFHWPVEPKTDLAFLQRTCGDVCVKECPRDLLFVTEMD